MKKRILTIFLAMTMVLSSCGTAGTGTSGQTAQEAETDAVTGTKEAGQTAAEETDTSESSKAAADGEVPSASQDVFAMDTYMSIACYGDRCEEACQAAVDEINRLDQLLSVGNADSEVSVVNANGKGQLGEEASEMVDYALKVYDTTDGAFDMTVYPLMQLWGFTSGDFAVPEQADIDSILAGIGSDRITWDESTGTIILGENQGMDLGGVAKGYTSTRLMEIFEDYDLVCGLVSLGGNVQLYRTKADGSLWKCGIQDPNHPDENAFLGILQAADKAVITSGAYERYFTDEKTGETYHHILDPKTGYPAEAGLISATIVTADGTLADTLSTACYVMGLDRSLDYWQEYGTEWGFDLILMTEDDQVYVTEGIADNFTSDYPVTIVTSEENDG